MRYLKKTILTGVCIAGMMAVGQSYGQGKNSYLSTLSSAGEVTVLKGIGSIEWNVGEPIIAIDGNDVASFSMGFEQGWGDTLAIKKDEMYIYPNPAYTNTASVKYVLRGDNEIITDSSKFVTSIDIRIISLTGQMMWSTTVPVEPGAYIFVYEFDVSKYNPGIYILNLIMDTGIKAARKFVKVRI